MCSLPFVRFLWLLLAFCFTCVQCSSHNQVQFYDETSKYAIAITSALYGNGTQARLNIVAPVTYGWAAIGSGAIMDGSAMFIVYPDETGQALTLSIRSTTGHYTPTLLESGKVSATLLNSSITNGTMSAIIEWNGNPEGLLYNGCSVTDPQQAWIWAVGPNQKIASNDTDVAIREHDHHGVFFADMPQSQNFQIFDPVIEGTTNLNVNAQPGYFHNLIVIHASLLVGAFVVVFPAAVVALRLNVELSFKMHWISQVVGTVAVIAGLSVAIFASITGIRFNSLTQPHQIVGIIVCLLVGLQIYLGREHHIHHVLYRKRSGYSHAHMLLGRLVIYGGIINASLGLRLAGHVKWGIVLNGIGLAILIIIEFMSARYNFRRSKNLIVDYEPLGLKELRKGKDAEVTVEEQMLSDIQLSNMRGR